MKPFTFKLDAVLKLRDFEKQEAYEVYGAAIRKRQEVEHACQHVSNEIKRVQTQINDVRGSVFPAAMQQNFLAALQGLQDQLKHLFSELAKAEAYEQAMLQAFLEAKSKVDMLDKLKQKRFDVHMKEELYKEEKEIDDLVNARYKSIAV